MSAAAVLPKSRWRRAGDVLVLRRWPSDVEVLVDALRAHVEDELARVAAKFGVGARDVEALRELAERAA